MKQVLNFLLVFLISISLKAQLKGNSAYKMKEVTIPTRWAQEVGPHNALKEYPRPQLQRENWINLNGLWDYAIVSTKAAKVSKYEGKILVPYPLESALSGVKKSLQPEQVIWYHRTFDKPVLKPGEKLLLKFGAVSWEATVYVNGKEAGKHSGAYTAFDFDITGLLKAGKNEIKLKVWNPLEKGIGPRGKQTLEPSGMWYTASSGIWQTVWLEKVPEHYIKSIKVTPDMDKQLVNVVVNASSLTAAKSKAIAKVANCSECEVLKQVQDDERINLTIKVPNAKLWSPDSPHLYDFTLKLGKDEVKSYFGMRKVEIKKDEKGVDRIFLNNKYTYNLGTLDQGFWPDGLYTAPTDEALKFDIEAIKSIGFNTIRKHIKVEPARWYYHADKLGVLVWQDLVQPGGKLGGTVSQAVKHQFERESVEMLDQLNHFPSITTWVLFNEGWGEYDQERLAKWVKQTDPTRLVNGHSGAVIVDGKLDKRFIPEVMAKSAGSDMTDVHSYPPPAIPNHIPGKAMVLGEFGGIGVQVDGHLWDDLQGVYSYGKTVGAGEMRRIYSRMIDSLVKFEKQGLSASIYTQPYDVEGEQNGIMSYDRELTKVPIEVLSNINNRLWPVSGGASNIKIAICDTAAIDFNRDIAQFKSGQTDSSFLRRLTILAWAKKDAGWMKTLSDAYIKQVRSPFAENNLKFIQKFLRNTSDEGFRFFNENREKVNQVLGKDAAEASITATIDRSEIKPLISSDSPDWKSIETKVSEKYGDIGREIVWQSKVLTSMNNKRPKDFQEALIPWFEEYGYKRKWVNANLVNNFAWYAFKNFSDTSELASVIKMTTFGLALEPDDDMLIDTHANLLHKLGKKQEAISWEEKAIALNPSEEIYKETLRKIKADIATWP